VAGVKGRSGPPGNLNAVKNGYQSWRRRRALPADRSHVNALVDAEELDLMRDKGGAEAISAPKRALIRDTGIAGGLIILALEEARKHGCIVVDPKTKAWDLAPGLQRIKALLDTRRANLIALGLEREDKDVTPTLDAIRRQYESPCPSGNGSGGHAPG